MSEQDKQNLEQLHGADEGHHDHRIGHMDDGEPITDSDINYGTLIFIAIVGSLATVAIVFALLGLYGRSVRQEQFSKRIGKSYEINWQQFASLRESQQAELSGEARWTNPDKGLVSIPMDEAIKATFLEEEARRAADLQAASQPPVTAQPAAPADPAAASGAADDATQPAAGAEPAATDQAAAEVGK